MKKTFTKKSSYGVSTGGTNRSLTFISGIKRNIPSEPSIVFTQEAWAQMCYIVDRCGKEVGWFTLQTYDKPTNTFRIHKVVLPEQEVTATETDISGEHWAAATFELIQAGLDTTQMYGWFHSHVNMGVTPSTQDERQVEEFLEDLVDVPEIPAFIRGIMNKKGDIKLDVYYQHHGIAYTCVPYSVEQPVEWTDGLDALIKERVKEAKPAYHYPHQWGGFQRHNPSAQAKPQPQLSLVPDDEEDIYDWAHAASAPATGFRQDLLTESEFVDMYDECYGYDWDETTPIYDRPAEWMWDYHYQAEGYDVDPLAHIAAAEYAKYEDANGNAKSNFS